MRALHDVRHRGAWLLCVALAACSRTEAPHAGDSAASVRVPLEVIESPGALATRREAQESFDNARDAVARKDFEGAATALSDAATFFQREARDAQPDMKQALDGTSEELDSLAVRAAHGELRTVDALDHVFARAHAAEASLHLLRAHAATIKRDKVRAGEELVMSVDHLERAMKDGRLQSDSAIQAAIADTRSLAGEMVQGMEAVPDEMARVTDEIEMAIRRICVCTLRIAPPPTVTR